MPCYNAAATLPDAVESIQRQDMEDWELLVCDDGSTDESVAVARCLAASDPRIRVLAFPRRGIVATLEAGCAKLRGPYLARMDADDRARPERLRLQLEVMRAHPDVGLCGGHVLMAGPQVRSGRERYAGWLNSLVTHDDIVRDLFVECPIAHPTFFMRHSALAEAGGYQDHGWAEDYDVCLRLFHAGFRFANVPCPILEWREHPSRLSMNDPRYTPAQFRRCKRHYLKKCYPATQQRRMYQWGAGEVGKVWLREWDTMRPVAVVDINPRKIGRVIHGFEIISPEALPAPGECFVVVAVGAPGARLELREWFAARGYIETQDFLFLA